MTAYAYSRIPAFNPNTSPASVARSASGSVYDPGDTGFVTPLAITDPFGTALPYIIQPQ